jgi:hypothetical protein
VRAASVNPIDWAVAAAAGVAGETAERGLRLLDVKAGDTLFVDGGAGGGERGGRLAHISGWAVLSVVDEVLTSRELR